MGQGWGPSRRLSFAERLELQRRVRDGETFKSAAAVAQQRDRRDVDADRTPLPCGLGPAHKQWAS